MWEVKRTHYEKGGKFFSDGATTFFNSRYAEHGYRIKGSPNIYFITSEKKRLLLDEHTRGMIPHDRREYTVRCMDERTGIVVNASELGEYLSRSGAVRRMERILADEIALAKEMSTL